MTTTDLSSYGTMPQRGNSSGLKSWNPKLLSPVMMRIMDLQLFNPTMKIKEIAQAIGWSPGRVSRIIGSDLYRTRYLERRAEVERLQHSKVARERARFQELREEMIRKHLELIDLDPVQYGGKELEAQKIRQKSINDLLRLSDENLKKTSDNGDGKEQYEERTRTVEIDPTDPNSAYLRLQETWRRGTK